MRTCSTFTCLCKCKWKYIPHVYLYIEICTYCMHWELYKSVDVNGLRWPVAVFINFIIIMIDLNLLMFLSRLVIQSHCPSLSSFLSVISVTTWRVMFMSVGSPGNLHACCCSTALSIPKAVRSVFYCIQDSAFVFTPGICIQYNTNIRV